MPIFKEHFCMAAPNIKIIFGIRFYVLTINFACCRRDFPSCSLHGLYDDKFCWNYETATGEIGLIIFQTVYSESVATLATLSVTLRRLS